MNQFLLFILALVPILLILVLMLGFRWGSVKAGFAGYISALVIAVLFFGARLDLLWVAHAKAIFLTLDVLMIIWAAFLFYRVTDEAGAVAVIGKSLPHLTGDRGMQALLIGWIFTSFLQGVGGFGVPVAVVSPIMLGLGFAPLTAVIIPSIGHGWAVTFGSLASSFQALIASTGLPGEVLAPASAAFLWVTAIVTGLLVAHAAGGWSALRRLWLPAIIFGTVMGGVQYVTATSGLWNIAAFTGSLAGMIVALPLARWLRGPHQDNGNLDRRRLVLALIGYAVLIAFTLVVQLIPAVRAFLGQVVLQMQFPAVSTTLGHTIPAGPGRGIAIFRHAGLVLFYSSVVVYLINRAAGLYKPGSIGRIVGGTVQRVKKASWSIAAMVTMAVIMEHSGMTEVLARGLAETMGVFYPLVAPWIGAIGAFMTGSNTNSNVVFGALQLRAAELLGFAATFILAGQTSGAGVASVMAPAKVIVGTSTVGMSGHEGEVMRKLSVYTLILMIVISILTGVACWWLSG